MYKSVILPLAKEDIREANKTILILAIFHTSRNPEFWATREMSDPGL